jgi:hypothetical protein
VDLSVEINLNRLYLGEEAVLHPVADKLNVSFLGITGFLDFVQKLENTTFRKLDLFPSSCEGEMKATLFDPIGIANFNHLTTPVEPFRI